MTDAEQLLVLNDLPPLVRWRVARERWPDTRLPGVQLSIQWIRRGSSLPLSTEKSSSCSRGKFPQSNILSPRSTEATAADNKSVQAGATGSASALAESWQAIDPFRNSSR